MGLIHEKRGLVVLWLMLMTSLEVTGGAVHKVGDSAGWTTIGNIDYKQWAVSKSFQVGDTIVFEYNPQFHNVMQVTHAEYKACNASSPITTHTTGNDSITIETHGHHFFMCGVPGHCQAGQKVDINIPRAPSVAATPMGLPAPPPADLTVPSPSPSSAAPTGALNMAFHRLELLLLLQLVYIFGLS